MVGIPEHLDEAGFDELVELGDLLLSAINLLLHGGQLFNGFSLYG